MNQEIIEITIDDPTWEDVPTDAIEITKDVDYIIIK